MIRLSLTPATLEWSARSSWANRSAGIVPKVSRGTVSTALWTGASPTHAFPGRSATTSGTASSVGRVRQDSPDQESIAHQMSGTVVSQSNENFSFK